LPAQRHGHITFGIFNNPAKISDACLETWGKVLAQLPDSRILLRYKGFYASALLQQRIVDAIGAQRVSPDRIDFVTTESGAGAQLDLYPRVDIALDTFPASGSTTTFEALWMGVPVVTLRGETMVSRWSASMLRALELEELIATTPAEYLATAVKLARETQRLAELRVALRPRLEASSLCDGARRARQFERLLRAIWRRSLNDSRGA
jgi:protein O-GlcNAc transferase